MSAELSLSSTPPIDLNNIRQLVAEDLALFHQLLHSDYHSSVPLINNISEYIIQCGGKHLRPLVLILMANACHYRGPASAQLATAIEFMHTASLLHDDVVDESSMRRGHKTVNEKWNNPSSVLVGDFLYSRAFQKIAHLENIPLIEILKSLANASNHLVEGEIIQLINRHNPNIDEEVYFNIVYYKTGRLFEVAAHFGSLLGRVSTTIEHAAGEYGKHLGVAFQLMDDVLDYSANPKKLGKNLGDDLASGSPTLPIIYAMQLVAPEQRSLLQKAIETGDISNLSEITEIIQNSGAIELTQKRAYYHSDLALQALQQLPATYFREGLEALTKFAIQRDH